MELENVSLFNTLIVHSKYFLSNSENLRHPIQMQLTKKQKTFLEFFAPFVKSASNFEHFEIKENSHSLCISEITVCQRCGCIAIQKAPFQNTVQQPTS